MTVRYDYRDPFGRLVTLLVPEQYVPPQAITLYDEDGNTVRFELTA